MHFNEYPNVEEADYDIKSSLNLNEEKKPSSVHENAIQEAMLEAMDWNILEDLDEISDEELLEAYGITKKEYLNPTEEVVLKIKRNKEEKNKLHKGR